MTKCAMPWDLEELLQPNLGNGEENGFGQRRGAIIAVHSWASQNSLLTPSVMSSNEACLSALYLLFADDYPILQTALQVLRSSKFPREIDVALTLDLLTKGEHSPVLTLLRNALEGAHSQLWGNPEGKDLLQNFMDTGETAMNISEHTFNAAREEMSQRLIQGLHGILEGHHRQLYSWQPEMHLTVSDGVLRRFHATGEYHLEWIELSEALQPHIPSLKTIAAIDLMRGFLGAREGDSVKGKGTSQGEWMMYSRAPWLRELPLLSPGERTQIERVMNSFSQFFIDEHGDWISTPIGKALALNLVASQELFSPNIVLEYGAVMEEYNAEWALASFDFTGGEKSQVAEVLRAVVNSAPRSA